MWAQVHQALQGSLHRAVFKVATLLPGVLALIVALVVSIFIGWALAAILRQHPHSRCTSTLDWKSPAWRTSPTGPLQDAHVPGHAPPFLGD